MLHFRSLLCWWGLLNKRLLKRPGFWAVLLAVPVLVLVLTLAASRNGGVVRIAVGLEEPQSPAARQVAQRLTERESVLETVLCESADEARTLVETGRADGAWLLPADLEERFDRLSAGEAVPLVTMVVQEDNVLLQLSREKLFAALYPDLSYALFAGFAESELQERSEEEIRKYYGIIQRNSRFIEFAYSDGSPVDPMESSFLVTPVRGILALLILVGALVSAMYFAQEAEAFVWMRRRKRFLLPFLCHLILTLDLAVAVLAALGLSGLVSSWPRELGSMALYCTACAGFAEVLRNILGKPRRLGAALPLVLLAGLALCPIFLNVRRFRMVQVLLPTFLYLYGIRSGEFILYLAGYTVLSWALGLILARIRGTEEPGEA
ncbi:MAG: hypothetical protein IJ206_00320 [Oscillospiraceae bacterium]|nr:hypothetical protein [Oscillospiraceae bacterium]